MSRIEVGVCAGSFGRTFYLLWLVRSLPDPSTTTVEVLGVDGVALWR